ncbi:MAG: siderophore-interacting protein [Cereibacter sphaeroides]|uniref:Siderophore-interacting protein n=1 Tax=Cereibacter sphaeroides TaxID=1063 RepID=A0A2W5UQP4_CERSP|nr:MAG: siderophore-interacting protein [Cereibacter sphaeroides]
MIRAGELTLNGRLPDAPGALAAHVGAVYGAHDMAESLPGGGILVTVATGAISFLPAEAGMEVRIIAVSEADLFVLREAVSSLVEAFDAGLSVIWDRPLVGGAYPPNFRIAQVVAKSRPGAGFLRIRLTAAHLGPFAVNGLHLRLLLPPEGRGVVWPSVSDQGRTVWPAGEDALHNPVYTIRSIDPVAGWMDLDIYLHGRGRTCHWAEEVAPGAIVGIVGPGGGDMLRAGHMVLAGDETALPAIARILEAAPQDAKGEAMILVSGLEHQQEIAIPPGICLRWLHRGKGETLEAALRDIAMPAADAAGGRHLWIATERTEATRLRAEYRERGSWGRGEVTVAAYWTDTDV